MVFGELLPQFLGISAPLRTARVVAVPVRVFSVLTRPLIIVLNGSANLVLRTVGITPQEELSGARTPQELASLVRRSAEVGTLDEGTALLVTRSLDFGERTAADVMSPRVRCTAVERTASAGDVAAAGAPHRPLTLPGDRRGLGRRRGAGARQAGDGGAARAARRGAGHRADDRRDAGARDDPAGPAAAAAARGGQPARRGRRRVRRHVGGRHPRGRRSRRSSAR